MTANIYWLVNIMKSGYILTAIKKTKANLQLKYVTSPHWLNAPPVSPLGKVVSPGKEDEFSCMIFFSFSSLSSCSEQI